MTPASTPRTHCRNDHELVGDNLILRPRAGTEWVTRQCRTCKENADRVYTERRRLQRQRLRNEQALAEGREPENPFKHPGRKLDGPRVHWEYRSWVGVDGRVYSTATAVEYERATEDSFRLAAVRRLKKALAEHGATLPRAGWETWGSPELDWATDLPLNITVRTIDPLPQVAARAA